jgi:hypothetical protein
MASPAWLTQEMQPSTPQATVPGLPAGVSSGDPSTPTAAALAPAPAPGANTPTSKGSISTASGSVQGPVQARFASAPGYAVPAPSYLLQCVSKCYHPFWKLSAVIIYFCQCQFILFA